MKVSTKDGGGGRNQFIKLLSGRTSVGDRILVLLPETEKACSRTVTAMKGITECISDLQTRQCLKQAPSNFCEPTDTHS